MGDKTFAIIKPDAVKNNYTGKIYNHILETGFTILSAPASTWIACVLPLLSTLKSESWLPSLTANPYCNTVLPETPKYMYFDMNTKSFEEKVVSVNDLAYKQSN